MNAAEEADKKDGQPGRIINRGTTSIGGPPSFEGNEVRVEPSSLLGAVTMKPAEPWWIEQADDAHPAPTAEEQRAALPVRDPSLLSERERRLGTGKEYVPDEDFDLYCRTAVAYVVGGLSNEDAKKRAAAVLLNEHRIDITKNPNWTP